MKKVSYSNIALLAFICVLALFTYSCSTNTDKQKSADEDFTSKKAEFKKMYEGLELEWIEDKDLNVGEIRERDSIIRHDNIEEARDMLEWLIIMDRESNIQSIHSKKIRARIIAKTFTEQEKKDLIKNRTLGYLTPDEKFQFLTDLYKAYGWERDENYTEREHEELLKNSDLYEYLGLIWGIEGFR